MTRGWHQLSRQEQQTLLQHARAVLTEKEYEAWRRTLDGAGYGRVGLDLDISKDTAADRIKRARRKLAKHAHDQENAA